jgi:hypothetical protein
MLELCGWGSHHLVFQEYIREHEVSGRNLPQGQSCHIRAMSSGAGGAGLLPRQQNSPCLGLLQHKPLTCRSYCMVWAQQSHNVTSEWSQKTLVEKLSGPSCPEQRIGWRLQSNTSVILRMRDCKWKQENAFSKEEVGRALARWLKSLTTLVWIGKSIHYKGWTRRGDLGGI